MATLEAAAAGQAGEKAAASVAMEQEGFIAKEEGLGDEDGFEGILSLHVPGGEGAKLTEQLPSLASDGVNASLGAPSSSGAKNQCVRDSKVAENDMHEVRCENASHEMSEDGSGEDLEVFFHDILGVLGQKQLQKVAKSRGVKVSGSGAEMRKMIEEKVAMRIARIGGADVDDQGIADEAKKQGFGRLGDGKTGGSDADDAGDENGVRGTAEEEASEEGAAERIPDPHFWGSRPYGRFFEEKMQMRNEKTDCASAEDAGEDRGTKEEREDPSDDVCLLCLRRSGKRFRVGCTYTCGGCGDTWTVKGGLCEIHGTTPCCCDYNPAMNYANTRMYGEPWPPQRKKKAGEVEQQQEEGTRSQ